MECHVLGLWHDIPVWQLYEWSKHYFLKGQMKKFDDSCPFKCLNKQKRMLQAPYKVVSGHASTEKNFLYAHLIKYFHLLLYTSKF